MAKITKIISPNNYYVYELDCDALKIMERHGLFADRCDNCNRVMQTVYFVPVLNKGICKNCYLNWIKYQSPVEDEWDQMYEETKSGEFERLVHALKIELIKPGLS